MHKVEKVTIQSADPFISLPFQYISMVQPLFCITIAQGSSGKLTTFEPHQFHIIWTYLQAKLFNFIIDQRAQSNFLNSFSYVVIFLSAFKTNMII